MIVQCPACRALVDVRTVSVEADRAGLRCSACEVTSWLPAAEAPDDVGAQAAAEPDNGATPQGDTHAVSAPPPPSSPPPGSPPSPPPTAVPAPAGLRAALARLEVAEAGEPIRQDLIALLDRWDDEASHKALIQRASLSDSLAVVGQGYRVVLEHRKDDAMAVRGRDLVLTTAMASLTPSNDAGELARLRSRFAVGVTIVCLLLVVALGYYMFANPSLSAEGPPSSSFP